MRVLKAYADSGATGGQQYGMMGARKVERGQMLTTSKASGDSVSLSAEAREMLATGGESLSVCPQDATYDQYGHVTRQFESLRNDLRNLAGEVLYSGNMALAGKISGLGHQLASIQAQV